MIAFEASAMVVDQTNDLRAQAAAFEKQALRGTTYDTLTGLPNRILLVDRLEQAINTASFERSKIAILVVDIDRFKDINDTLGHSTGDRVIRQIAQRLRKIIPEPNTVARLGGDEFGIILKKFGTKEDAAEVVHTIKETLQVPLKLEGVRLDIDASIGITLYPEHGKDAQILLQRADVAMYQAKQKHCGFIMYTTTLDRCNTRRLTLMGELREAIINNELVAYYQPKIDIKTGKIKELEALVRWKHKVHGLVQPDDFIPMAEQTGLIKQLTLWILHESLMQCAKWNDEGFELRVSVNLSANDLMDVELPETITRTLNAHNVPPEKLLLEITESAVMLDPNRALEVLTNLSTLGVRLSVDDFGTGYSSLSYLSKLPVSELKIDKSFVMGMENNSNNTVIVQATIDLGHNLGLEVVAEGVETTSSISLLQPLGCDTLQGYYFTKPLSAQEFNTWRSQNIATGRIRKKEGQLYMMLPEK
ncbi:MAG: EAL domain-containing protein [Betaproteobacteria bacterium]|nr:MAG: EAL domain-containing protein [Betaproteobacteria bacterium]